MSAWPEAVWIVKKMNQVFDITQIIENNNILVDPLNAKLDQTIARQHDVESDANTAVQQINNAGTTLSNLQTQVNDLSNDVADLKEQLENVDSSAIEQARQAIEQYKTDIDKELVVIATNSGTSQNPRPTNIGTNVSKHSVFLIEST